MLLAVFVICLVASFYPLGIYPVLVMGLARLRPRPWKAADETHSVDFMITVFNEEHRIREKLEDTLALKHDCCDLKIIAVSDGSTDGTERLVGEFMQRGVQWLGCRRQGKESAQIEAVRRSTADIVVFSDASTQLEPDSLIQILRPFADPTVGAVSGCDMVDGAEQTSGEKLFLRYEMALRNAESLCGSLVGLSGCFFAVRREVAQHLVAGVPSDLGTALICARMGLRAVSQQKARCYYARTTGSNRLFRRWHRTALRGIRGLWAYRDAVSWRRPLVSWQILSHKWLRFLSPVFAPLAMLTVAAGALNGQPWALWMTPTIVGLISVSLLSLSWPLRTLHLFRPIGFVVVTNCAVIAAWASLVNRQTHTTWTPTPR